MKCLLLSALLFVSSKSLVVSTSIYHPVPSQGWGDGTLTRSGDRINLKALQQGKLRWVSISRNLHVSQGGRYRFNDTIRVSGNGYYSGSWVIKDFMNRRFVNKIDFLQAKTNRQVPPRKLIIY